MHEQGIDVSEKRERNDKMSTIPKIKKEDRTKVIDRPDLLVVHPHTHHASKRYGHFSQWCTSTSNPNHWYRESRRSIILYCLIYNTLDGKRVGEKTKVAIICPKRGEKRLDKVTCYDRQDNFFSMEVLQAFMTEQDLDTIKEYLKLKKQSTKPKQVGLTFLPGQLVKCMTNTKVRLSFRSLDTEGWNKHLKRIRNRSWGSTEFYKKRYYKEVISISLKKEQIVEAEVIDSSLNWVKLRPTKLADIDSDIADVLIKRGATLKLNMTTRKTIESINET